MKIAKLTTLALVTGSLFTASALASDQNPTIEVTAENFSHAETSRNFRNWTSKGATERFVKMQAYLRAVKKRQRYR